MKKLFKNLPDNISALIKTIGAYADTENVSVYLVGGFVRDLFLGRDNFDLDIVLEKDAIVFAKGLAKKLNAEIVTHPRFMTTTLYLRDGIRVDLTTARKEEYPCSGALPTVHRGSIEDDLLRRDFTINAMAIVINKKDFGKVIDESKCLKDLKSRVIRVFHNKSFIDDPTRILRAVRFEQRFNFRFESSTRKALRDAIKHKASRNVTPGRYFDEFKKFFSEKNPAKCLKRLSLLKGLVVGDIELSLDNNNFLLIESIRKNIKWVQKNCRQKTDLSQWVIYFMALVDNISIDNVQKILNDLYFSRKDQAKVLSSKTEYDIVKRMSYEKMKPGHLYKILKPLSTEELVFFLSKCSEDSTLKCIMSFLYNYQFVEISTKGEDLLRLGVTDGKVIGKILDDLLFRKIDGEIRNKEDEMRFVEQMNFDLLKENL